MMMQHTYFRGTQTVPSPPSNPPVPIRKPICLQPWRRSRMAGIFPPLVPPRRCATCASLLICKVPAIMTGLSQTSPNH